MLCDSPLYAHDDLDLAIESIEYDEECRAIITIKNEGRDLPESFYQVVRPAFVVMEKGKQREEFKSLRTLDKQRALARSDGRLKIVSRTRFTQNPQSAKVTIHFEDEFIDYGAANNQLNGDVDCLAGKGSFLYR